MLSDFRFSRFAPNDSPNRERRLVGFAGPNFSAESSDSAPDGFVEHKTSDPAVESIREETHAAAADTMYAKNEWNEWEAEDFKRSMLGQSPRTIQEGGTYVTDLTRDDMREVMGLPARRMSEGGIRSTQVERDALKKTMLGTGKGKEEKKDDEKKDEKKKDDEKIKDDFGTRDEEKEKKLNLKDVAEHLKSTSNKIKELVQKLEDTRGTIEKSFTDDKQKDHLETLQYNIDFLNDGLSTMSSWERLLELLKGWEAGDIHPNEFIPKSLAYFYGRKEGEDPEKIKEARREFQEAHPNVKGIYQKQTLNADGTQLIEDMWNADASDWNDTGLNRSTRQEIAAGSSGNFLNHIDGYLKNFDAHYEKQDKYIRDIDLNWQKIKKKGKTEEGGAGLKFMSINEIIESVKNVVEAFKTAGKEWSQLRVAGLSAQLGHVAKHLPFGDEAQQTLSAALNHKDDEVKDHYKKHLESDLVPFEEMIPHPHHGIGFLERNKNDGNRFRGTLEYMAKKAWLYDINLEERTVMGHKLIPGKTVPATWNDTNIKQYLISLEEQHKSGQKSEIDRGYARVDRLAAIEPGIEILREEMKDGDYWATLGIMNRLLLKAKEGHTATWFAATLLRMLREDPIARRYFPKDLMDRLGNEGLVHLANTNILWVLDRHAIRDWADASGGDNKMANKTLEKAGQLGTIVSKVEKAIHDMETESGVPHLEPPELEVAVAKILASQPVKLKGWKRALSIFDPRFADYRSKMKAGGEGKAIDPSKTDDDFFNEDSEMIMHGPNILNRILAVRSPSDLQFEEKAIAFMGQLLRRKKQLEKAGLEADLRTFQEETQKSMAAVFEGSWNGDVSQNFHTKYRHSEGSKTYLLESLVAAGLVNVEHLQKMPKQSKLVENLLDQIGVSRRLPSPPSPPATGTSRVGSTPPTVAP